MNIKEIQELIRFVAKSGVSEVAIEQLEFKITIKAGMPPQAAYYSPPYPPAETASYASTAQKITSPVNTGNFNKPETADTSHYITIKSPMIGTFYRTPGPNKDNFVQIGEEITPGKVVCIIEAMKLFNDIEAEISGRVVKILVDNASPVEYDQPLFLIDPL